MKRNITVIQHEVGCTQIDYVLTEIIPQRRKERSLLVINVYSSPKLRKGCGFRELFAKAQALAQGKQRLVIVGDFNAPHQAWGYHHSQIKGRELWDAMIKCNLTLLNDPLAPTRQGNSVSFDTSPDLAMVGADVEATWHNTRENLGSDHRIIEIVVQNGVNIKRERKILKSINWQSFRTNGADCGAITDIVEWTNGIKRACKEAEEEVELDEEQNWVDSHMRQLWQKKNEAETELAQKRATVT